MLEHYTRIFMRIKTIRLDIGNVSNGSDMPIRRHCAIKRKKLFEPCAID